MDKDREKDGEKRLVELKRVRDRSNYRIDKQFGRVVEMTDDAIHDDEEFLILRIIGETIYSTKLNGIPSDPTRFARIVVMELEKHGFAIGRFK